MSKYIKAVLLFVGIVSKSYGQSVACPEVFVDDILIPSCAATDSACVSVMAKFPDIRQTVNTANAYVCNAIPFSGNYGFNIGGTAVSVGQDDYWSPVVNLPFNFCYFGNTYNQCLIGPNGGISFDISRAGNRDEYRVSAGDTVPGPMVGSDQSHLNTIFACYHDMDPSVCTTFPFFGCEYIYWQIVGVAPCRKLVVNWVGLPQYDCNSLRSTVQCVLYENTNVIEMYIRQKPVCSSWESGQAIIGLQNIDGTQGIAAPGRNKTVWNTTTANSEAWQFVPNGVSLLDNVGLYSSADNSLVQLGVASPPDSGLLSATFNNICVRIADTSRFYVKAAYTSCSGTDFSDTTHFKISEGGSTVIPVPTVVPVSYCQNATATPLTATGVAGATFSWYTTATGGTASATAPIPSTAVPGTVTYYVSQGIGSCESPRVPVTVSVTAGPSATITGALNYCVGGTTLTASGGTGFSWSTGQTTASISATAGNYSVTVIDGGACSATASVTVTQDASPTANITGNLNVCAGATTTLTASGGTSYIWSNGATTDIITVGVGTYSVTVAISPGCSGTGSVTVTEYPSPQAAINGSLTYCTGGTTLTASGGATYLWSTGETTASVLLTAGNYVVTVTDTNSCTATANATVLQANDLSPTISGALSYCAGTNTVLTVNGGTSFLWSTNETTASVTVTQGTYSVTVADAGGCTGTATATVTENSNPVPAINGADIACAGGTTTLIGTGGVSYVWSSGASTPTAVVPVGSYVVTATDVNGCTAVSAPFSVAEPAPITFNPPTVVNVQCPGYANGSISSSATGGTGVISYVWLFNSVSFIPSSPTNPTGLAGGQYTQLATDANGCSNIAIFDITEPIVVWQPAIITDVRCNGESTGQIVSGAPAVGQYSYLWSHDASLNSAVASGLPTGVYGLTATDANGCTSSRTFSVQEPSALVIQAYSINESCYAASDGSILTTASGGTLPYEFVLFKSGNFEQLNSTGNFASLSPGAYTVELTDANGCIISQSIAVLGKTQDIYTINTDTPSCYGVEYTDGAIYVSVQGDYAPYQYALNDNNLYLPDSVFHNLGAGIYTVYARNRDGCVQVLTATVPEAYPVSAVITPQDTTIHLGDQITLYSSVFPASQGTANSYQWSPEAGLSCSDCPNPVVTSYQGENRYEVTITYNTICEATAKAYIVVVSAQELYIPSAFSPNGDGNNDVFEIYGKALKSAKIKVFNRWGEKVFDSMNNPFTRWDGTYKGELLPPMVYTYEAEVEFLDGKTKRKLGSVTLIR